MGASQQVEYQRWSPVPATADLSASGCVLTQGTLTFPRTVLLFAVFKFIPGPVLCRLICACLPVTVLNGLSLRLHISYEIEKYELCLFHLFVFVTRFFYVALPGLDSLCRPRLGLNSWKSPAPTF